MSDNQQPDYVTAVFDSGERWADRYRIVLASVGPDGWEHWAIVTGDQGNRPNAVFMSADHTEEQPLNGETAIAWADLPDVVRRDIIADVEGMTGANR